MNTVKVKYTYTVMSNIVNGIKNIFRRALSFRVKSLLTEDNIENSIWTSPDFDDVLIDHIMRGDSYMEICEIYGIPYDTLKQRLRHIAYDMYVERRSIMEIRSKTGVSAQELLGEIDRREGPDKSKCIRSQREGIYEPLY